MNAMMMMMMMTMATAVVDDKDIIELNESNQFHYPTRFLI